MQEEIFKERERQKRAQPGMVRASELRPKSSGQNRLKDEIKPLVKSTGPAPPHSPYGLYIQI